jgi:hypothetical protein
MLMASSVYPLLRLTTKTAVIFLSTFRNTKIINASILIHLRMCRAWRSTMPSPNFREVTDWVGPYSSPGFGYLRPSRSLGEKLGIVGGTVMSLKLGESLRFRRSAWFARIPGLLSPLTVDGFHY